MSYKARKVYQDPLTALEYDKQRFSSFKGRLVNWREMSLVYKAIRLAGIMPPARILDIPCGTGRLSLFLAEKGYRVIGVDISPTMIEQGKKKLEDSPIKQQVKFEVGDGESLSFKDSFFDVGVSLRLFGHLPTENRRNVLKELSRVSRSVVVAYYYKNSIQVLLRKRMRVKKDIYWNPVNFRQIDEELKATGLERVANFSLLPLVSETIVILAEKLKQ